MRADLVQDLDGKLWLLVEGPDGNSYRISHEMATAPLDLPPLPFPSESVKWPDPPYRYFMPGLMDPAGVRQWIGGLA